MSNNPFLSSREHNKSSNRFSALVTSTDNLYNDIKKDKKYATINNSFTKSNNFERKQNKSVKDNSFVPKTDLIIISEEAFPSLASNNNQIDTNTINFKDVLNHSKEKIVKEDNTLKPGWIEISKINGTINIIDNSCPEKVADLHFLMRKTISQMQKKWVNSKTIYDDIYGEEAFDNLHYLSPVYDSDYDSDESQVEEDIYYYRHDYRPECEYEFKKDFN